jgi:hypothetical protein
VTVKRIASKASWEHLREKLDSWDWVRFPQRMTIEPDRGEPVQDCFAVFWIWMEQMSKEFTERGRKTSKDEMHDIMCHKFLGYTDERKINNTIIKPALITLTYPKKKTKDAMIQLLCKIDEWAIDQDVYLITKKSSEYAKYKESN